MLSRITGPASRLYAVDFDDDGDRLSAVTGETVWLWDTEDAADVSVAGVLNYPPGALYALAFSPDGAGLAAAGADQRVFVWATDID